ncbi:phage tail spike protein [Leuconostoc mesenteroides]|uniref:phage tail spike protein n=1 Tax=Leuconostoc mesenteroides TaxID=1245 RepID=UPI00235F7CD8|nr:phage tail spike protein [Leuconostoc mesenteroides]
MTPILYEKDEIDFTSQGLGSLVEIYDVDVEEQRNGLLQLTASYPVSGVRYADISVGRIILAKPNQRDDVHAFRIVSTELDISGYAVRVEADSITYDLTHNLVKHLVASGNGQSFMAALKNAVVNPSIFAFYSDIATSSTTLLNYVNPMEAIMGTTGSFLQIWGGELKRENRRVAMFNRRGRDNVATFRLGKNISGLKYSVDISSLVTRIIPTKSVQNDDQTTTTLEGTPVDSQYINNYEQIYTLPLEFTDDTIKTVADLNAAAKGWFTKSANTGRDKPTVTIDIDVLSLQDSADYQDKFKNLESVSLTDTVTVYVPEYGVNVTAIVNELHYDPILDRVTKMTVGTAKQSFADSSRTQLSDLQDKIISVKNQADAVAVSANGKSTNYYGSVEPSHPQKGDTWFWVNGDKSGIKIFVNGEWVDPVDSDTQEKIAAGVTEAVTQAKAHTDEVKQSLSTDIETAKSQAASLAITAEANAKSEATSLFNQAQSILSDAKKDLTKSISSEASKAVAAANSQAQNYVNQAKSDINDTINALSVGGRNLALGTSNQVVQANAWNMQVANIKYDKSLGGTLCASVMINNADHASDLLRGSAYIVLQTLDKSGKVLKSVDGDSVNYNANGLSWCSITIDDNTASAQAVIFTNNMNQNTFYSCLKIERGNLPTDWTPAPEDVVLDYTTKDNKIKETISQYQDTNDGHVSKLQTDVSTALGQIETKISKTVYDQKTGDLSSKINETKDTADKSAQTIADIQEADGKQDARMSEIENTASGLKSTVSDISKAQGEQSGSISTLKQRADGFDATVTKVNNLSVGGRNLFIMNNAVAGYIGTDGKVYADLGGGDMTSDFIAVSPNETWQLTSWRAPNMTGNIIHAYYDSNKSFIAGSEFFNWLPATKPPITIPITIPQGVAYMRVSSQHMNSNQGARVKVEKGSIATDWTPAPEDVDSATAKAQLTANEASAAVTKLTSADGVITKAQADIKANADAITKTVSKTVYDQKTGDLTQAISKAQSTADGAVSTVGNYQTSNDKRVSDAESKIEQNSKDITSKVSQTYYDQKTGELSGNISTLQQRADGFDTTVTKVNNLSVGGRNLLLGTEQFTGEWNRWQWSNTWGADPYSGHKAVQTNHEWGGPKYVINDLFNRKVVSPNTDYTLSVKIKNTSHVPMDIYFFASGIGISYRHIIKLPPNSDWTTISTTFQFSDINPNIKHGSMRFEPSSGISSWQGVIIQTEMKLEKGTIPTDWTPAPEDTATAIAQVKITADGINNFVRDSSGNISSDFQTALSKISIITGSTLATSIQKQTSSQISSAITDNNGKIISLINQNSSGVQIAGKNLAITADTTVDGNFWAKQVNAVQVNASNITVGTLNGNQVNITNINANNIVSGAISGANLNINLNTGQVQFQKGRINSSDYTTDINIDQGYISTANDNTRALIKQGMIQLVAPNRFDLDSSPYMEISNNRGQSTAGAAIIGRDSVSIANSKNSKNIFPAPIGTETFSGLYTGQAFDGGWLPTKVAGADRGVVVAGGTETTWQVVNSSPYIRVGTDASGSYSYGNRVAIQAEFLHATTVYNQSGSGGANVYVASDGALVKSSSATKYKTNIEHETDSIQGDQLLTIDPATWNDKFESEQLERYHETGVEPERQINMEGKRYYGIIAEDLVKAGLEELVTRNEETDEVEGVEYSKIGVALIPIVRDLRNKLNEQAVEIERLKDKNK